MTCLFDCILESNVGSDVTCYCCLPNDKIRGAVGLGDIEIDWDNKPISCEFVVHEVHFSKGNYPLR